LAEEERKAQEERERKEIEARKKEKHLHELALQQTEQIERKAFELRAKEVNIKESKLELGASLGELKEQIKKQQETLNEITKVKEAALQQSHKIEFHKQQQALMQKRKQLHHI